MNHLRSGFTMIAL